MTELQKFVNALVRVGETPCEQFACERRPDCGREQLACDAFRLYVTYGKTADPHYAMPSLRISKKWQWQEDILATHEKFDGLDQLSGKAE
jgi:hypothetical protein